VLEQRASENAFIDTKSFSNAGKVPNGLNSKLGHVKLASGVETDLAVRNKPALPDTVFKLGQLHVSSCHCNGRSDFDVFLVHQVLEKPRSQVTKRIHRHDLLGVRPCREGTNVSSRLRVGEIRLVISVELLGTNGERVVDTVRAAVGTDGVTSADRGRATGDNNWPSLMRILGTC